MEYCLIQDSVFPLIFYKFIWKPKIKAMIILALGTFQILLIVLGSLLILLFPLLALISVLKNDFSGNDKIIWVLVIIFLPFFGSILYFAVGRSRKL